MKSKTVEATDYRDIRNEVRFLLREEARLRGKGVRFEVPHPHRYWEYGSALAAIAEFQIPVGARILDVGCGHSLLGPTLAIKGFHVEEIDPSLNVERRKNLKEFLPDLAWNFSCVDLLDFTSDSPFDAVLCVSVLEHVPLNQQVEFVRRLVELVKPGGLLFLTIDFGLTGVVHADLRTVLFNDASAGELIAALISLGVSFSDVDLKYYGPEVFDYTFLRLIGKKD